jgi:hypothetical protein
MIPVSLYAKFGAVFLLVVVLVWAVPAALHGRAEATRYKGLYETEQGLLVQAQARTALIQKQVQSAVVAANAARAQLKEVLDASPEVRDAATPEPVRVSLCATLRCK